MSTLEKSLQQLVEKLRAAYGDRLIAVVLYGSAAADDRDSHFSDLNILCVLTSVTLQELRPGEPIFRWWREQGNPAPLLIGEQELASSSDCFPIEFQDIQQQHSILYGKDVVSGMAIGRAYWRAQVEHELRAKFFRLRQKAAGMLSETDLLRRLLADSVSTFCVLFRHALLLHGIAPARRKRETIEHARECFAIDTAPFERLLDLREGRVKPRDVEPATLLASYLEGIERVIAAVDRLEK